MNKNVPLILAGEVTPKVVIYKAESHKLCEAFNVKEGETILKGMPVALETDGTISPFLGTEGQVYLGVAITDNVNPAYKAQRDFPVEVTVMVEGYITTQQISDDAIDCGYVIPTGNTVNGQYVEYTQAESETKFIAITPADEAAQVIRILVR